MKSRRTFLKLMATGSAAVLAGNTVAAAAPAKSRGKRSAPAAPAASPDELRKQKEYTAAALKVIREYKLPPGAAEPAFTFAPMVAAPATPQKANKP